MTILFVLSSPEYLRFFDGTLSLLAARGHQIHVVFDEAADYKPVGLTGASTLPLASATVVPRARTFWGDTAIAFRGVVDYLRFLHPDYIAAPILRERVRRKVLPRGCQWLQSLPTLPPGVLRSVLRMLAAGERALPVARAVRDTLTAREPDVVVVSPLVEAASPQVDWIKEAQRRGVPAAVAVASWDNLTNKGLMRVEPDAVFVWNDVQRGEAVRYHAVSPDRIVSTGAPAFDRWFDRQPSRDRASFCRAAGLTDDRPFLLFTCSSPFIAGDGDEVSFVQAWLRAVRSSPDRRLRDAGVLIRPHPYHTAAWAAAAINDPLVAVWPRGPFNPAAEDARQNFFDSLHHAAAVVGLNTSAMIEAAVVGRPVFTMSALETQRGTLHFQYLLQEHGGPVVNSATLDEHAAHLASALRAAGPPHGVQAFVRSFVRPHGVTEAAAPRLARAIEETQPAAARTSPLAIIALRPLLAVFGGWVLLVARLTSRTPFAPVRKQVLDPLRSARRRLERSARLWRERAVRSGRLSANRMRRAGHVVRRGARAVPSGWKRVRRAARQARYAIGMMRRGHSAAPPGKS